MSKKKVITVSNVSKHFRLPTEKSNSLKQIVVNWTRGIKGYKEQQVLREISFDVEEGDFYGIVGRNGSGKSTLLKLISGIYKPNSGSIEVNGSLVSFIELGVGFNSELTGRENVYLNGALMGFSAREVDEMYDDIVEFAELEEFMEQKLKNYSSGMKVRLAFSCAIRAKSDILVLDEVLAVGDEAFQRKCDDFFAEIKQDKTKTVVLVTHSMSAVRKYCTKAIMIRDGKIIAKGSPEDVANAYSLENVMSANSGEKKSQKTPQEHIKDLNVELLSNPQVSQKDEIKIKVSYKTKEDITTKVYLTLYDKNRQAPLYDSRSPEINSRKGEVVEQTFTIVPKEINDSTIQVRLSIRREDGDIISYLSEEDLPSFIVRRTDYKKIKNTKNESDTKNTYSVLFNTGKWS